MSQILETPTRVPNEGWIIATHHPNNNATKTRSFLHVERKNDLTSNNNYTLCS